MVNNRIQVWMDGEDSRWMAYCLDESVAGS
jgi:hypothetical protein